MCTYPIFVAGCLIPQGVHRRVSESLSVFYSGVPISLEYFAWGCHKLGKPNSLWHRAITDKWKRTSTLCRWSNSLQVGRIFFWTRFENSVAKTTKSKEGVVPNLVPNWNDATIIMHSLDTPLWQEIQVKPPNVLHRGRGQPREIVCL